MLLPVFQGVDLACPGAGLEELDTGAGGTGVHPGQRNQPEKNPELGVSQGRRCHSGPGGLAGAEVGKSLAWVAGPLGVAMR